MLNVSLEAVLITKRFFIAIDILIAQRKIRGLNSFAQQYSINYWNLCTLKKEPERRILKPEYIAFLVRDFNVSSKFILLGIGNIIENENNDIK